MMTHNSNTVVHNGHPLTTRYDIVSCTASCSGLRSFWMLNARIEGLQARLSAYRVQVRL